MSKCPISWCNEGHKNFNEHYADMRVKKDTTADLVTEPINNVTKRPIVTKAVTKKADLPVTKPVTKSDKGRVYAWREKNRARYNETQRELMRKRANGLLDNGP